MRRPRSRLTNNRPALRPQVPRRFKTLLDPTPMNGTFDIFLRKEDGSFEWTGGTETLALAKRRSCRTLHPSTTCSSSLMRLPGKRRLSSRLSSAQLRPSLLVIHQRREPEEQQLRFKAYEAFIELRLRSSHLRHESRENYLFPREVQSAENTSKR